MFVSPQIHAENPKHQRQWREGWAEGQQFALCLALSRPGPMGPLAAYRRPISSFQDPEKQIFGAVYKPLVCGIELQQPQPVKRRGYLNQMVAALARS